MQGSDYLTKSQFVDDGKIAGPMTMELVCVLTIVPSSLCLGDCSFTPRFCNSLRFLSSQSEWLEWIEGWSSETQIVSDGASSCDPNMRASLGRIETLAEEYKPWDSGS